jgi:hypothetical protein
VPVLRYPPIRRHIEVFLEGICALVHQRSIAVHLELERGIIALLPSHTVQVANIGVRGACAPLFIATHTNTNLNSRPKIIITCARTNTHKSQHSSIGAYDQ